MSSTVDLLSPSNNMLARPADGEFSRSPHRKGASKGRKEEVKRGGKTLKGKKRSDKKQDVSLAEPAPAEVVGESQHADEKGEVNVGRNDEAPPAEEKKADEGYA